MATWREFESAAPELAQVVRAAFGIRKHATMATLRRDGSPRISGTEVEFGDTDIFLGSMPGAVKALDLRRDPRLAIHSPTVDPPEHDPSDWPGEAKISGVAQELTDVNKTTEPHRFRIDVREVVHTRVVDNRLQVTSWHPNRGLVTRNRD